MLLVCFTWFSPRVRNNDSAADILNSESRPPVFILQVRVAQCVVGRVDPMELTVEDIDPASDEVGGVEECSFVLLCDGQSFVDRLSRLIHHSYGDGWIHSRAPSRDRPLLFFLVNKDKRGWGCVVC